MFWKISLLVLVVFVVGGIFWNYFFPPVICPRCLSYKTERLPVRLGGKMMCHNCGHSWVKI